MAKPAKTRTASARGQSSGSDPLPQAYRPIACGTHDRLEDLATRGVSCAVEYLSETGETVRRTARFLDIYAEAGVEYLQLSSGERVRLDRLVSFQPEP